MYLLQNHHQDYLHHLLDIFSIYHFHILNLHIFYTISNYLALPYFVSLMQILMLIIKSFKIRHCNIKVTTNDLVALWIQYLQNNTTSQIKIGNTTDVDEFTKIVDMTYIVHSAAGTLLPLDDYSYDVKCSLMFALSQDRNTGYQIFNNMATPNIWNRTEHSPACTRGIRLV